ncbi:hypothetical protein SAMN05421812_105153 [Asanoa hainanensis]|uniref:Uncharacterized protein n=1 Tax=Asanoa hainanensis TaxID=560556 RepID=A0A239M7D8_9ACTN|nr:hypothetical protein [Asanoa hainanensis]SNT37954.1 hypothetical protein SAMN05421812_105153 [Asanoa hainanensis]
MKVHLPLMVQDPLTASVYGVPKTVEGMHLIVPEDSWITDGPSTPRITVVDLDLRTGRITPPAVFEPPAGRRRMGRFRLEKPYELYSPEFIQVAVFAAVAKTMRTIDPDGALGRALTWRDPSRPLRILPRAGPRPNALYDREAQELRFFYFAHPVDSTQTIYTALARDIVAHECAHAIIDGIAPFLYDAMTPQTLAIHEAVADLCAVLTSFRSGTLTTTVLERTRGLIGDSTAFSAIAPQFGQALAGNGHQAALRNLWNDHVLERPSGDTTDVDVHRLSEVLSGLLYAGMARMQDERATAFGFSNSGFMLAQTSRRLQRLILRALDLLPPAEVSFADYLRCLVHAAWIEDGNAGGFMEDPYGAEVDFFVAEAVRRGIVGRPGDLGDGLDEAPYEWFRFRERTAVDHGEAPYSADEMRRLVEDDAYAHTFVDRRREVIGIPQGADFTVLRRTLSSTSAFAQGWYTGFSELLVKVAWHSREHIGPAPAGERIVRRGATLVIDGGLSGGRLHTIIRGGFDDQRAERDAFLGWARRAGLLTTRPAPGKLVLTEVAGAQLITGGGALLHSGPTDVDDVP